MTKNTFHFVNGFFVVAASVIGLSLLITTYHVMSAPLSTNPNVTQIQGEIAKSSGGVQKYVSPWSTESVKKLGFAVVPKQGTSITVSLKTTVGKGAQQFAFVPTITDFSQTPTTFTPTGTLAKNAAGKISTWGVDPQITIPLTAATKGKWITVYGFVRNDDGFGVVRGMPFQIDDVAAIIFQIPESIGETITNTAPTAPLISVAAATNWPGIVNAAIPSPNNQVVGFVKVQSNNKTESVELRKIKLFVGANGPYTGSVALVRMPVGADLNDWSLLGTGDPTDPTVTSTIGLGYATTQPVGAVYQTELLMVMPKGVILPPGGSLTFAITADSISKFSPKVGISSALMFKVTGVAARSVGVTTEPSVDDSIFMPTMMQAEFTPISVTTALGATSPGGSQTGTQNAVVGRFVLINASNPWNLPAVVTHIGVQIMPKNVTALAGAMVRLYKGGQLTSENELGIIPLSSASAAGTPFVIKLSKPLVIESGAQEMISLTADTMGMTSGSLLQGAISNVHLGVLGDEKHSVLFDALSMKGKQLYY